MFSLLTGSVTEKETGGAAEASRPVFNVVVADGREKEKQNIPEAATSSVTRATTSSVTHATTGQDQRGVELQWIGGQGVPAGESSSVSTPQTAELEVTTRIKPKPRPSKAKQPKGRLGATRVASDHANQVVSALPPSE